MTKQHPKTVTLELPYGALAGWPVVLDALRKARETTGYHLTFTGLIHQIEAQLPKPKPEEPTGLGAVVEDADGERWVRSHPGACPWTRPHLSGTYAWPQVAAVRVLSEGVTP